MDRQHDIIPFIAVDADVPGIRSLVQYRPETGRPLYKLVQVLLRGPGTLSESERELIAAYVSTRNECNFCARSHAAAARCLYGSQSQVVDALLKGNATQGLSSKMTALLEIAGEVQVSGQLVTPDLINIARTCGASDREIHDTVLIAATFSMFNRYVDGLNSFTPQDPEVYAEMGKRMMGGYHFPASNVTGGKQDQS